MKNIKLVISYDGTGLFGWQKTSFGPTIEEHLEKTLSHILQETIYLQAASRTDAGVHAEGQVVNFFTEKKTIDLEKLRRSINRLISKQIIVLSIEEMPGIFHPTLNNTGKEYHYYLCNSPFQKPKHRLFSWHFPYPLDIRKIKSLVPQFVGTHDFSTFSNSLVSSKRDPLCTLYSLDIEDLGDDRFCFKIRGNRFLFRMVRNMIGTLAYIGCGKIQIDSLSSLLQSRDRTAAGITAPPHGLHLIEVFYPKDI